MVLLYQKRCNFHILCLSFYLWTFFTAPFKQIYTSIQSQSHCFLFLLVISFRISPNLVTSSGILFITLSPTVLLSKRINCGLLLGLITKKAIGFILTPAPLPPPNGSLYNISSSSSFLAYSSNVSLLNSLPPAAKPNVTFETGISD